ncbi:MAG: sugar ABC transporter ATP-binding protein [bacterium]
MSGEIVRMEGISKSFPGVKALNNVSISINRGEVLSVVGENGAGKSTLMKILAGVYHPDEGRILYEGTPTDIPTPHRANELGISTIFQEFNLCPNLSAMENIALGREPRGRARFLSFREMKRNAQRLFEWLGIIVDAEQLVRSMGVAKQQMVEIAKALGEGSTKILIMDEPTSSLARAEIDSLFRVVRDLREHGIGIVFISHKLDEVLEVSDRVVVLRDGELVGAASAAEATQDSLIGMMVGKQLGKLFVERSQTAKAEPALEVEGLSGPPNIRNVTFTVNRGEILGLAGLVGAGRTEMAMLLMGLTRPTAGTVRISGRSIAKSDPTAAVAHGLAYLPEDRKTLGLVLDMAVRDNITLGVHSAVKNRAGFMSRARETELTRKYMELLRIRAHSVEQRVRTLSGGNQQKTVIGKWLATEPQVIIMDEPTRGIDVGAKAEVHRIIAELADKGVAVLMISSELTEVIAVSDRIIVMSEGRLTGEFAADEATREAIMSAAIGAKERIASTA